LLAAKFTYLRHRSVASVFSEVVAAFGNGKVMELNFVEVLGSKVANEAEDAECAREHN
jgi:hypothetical protein